MERFTDKNEMLHWVRDNGATLVVQGHVAGFEYQDLAISLGFYIKHPITYTEFFQNKQDGEIYVFADIDAFMLLHRVRGYGHKLLLADAPLLNTPLK